MNSKKDILYSIVRLFTGEASPNEKIDIGDWLNLSVENEKLFYELEEIWFYAGIENNADNYNIEEGIRKFQNRIKKEKKTTQRKLLLKRFLKYAAIAVLLIAIPLSYYFGKSENKHDSFTKIACDYGNRSMLYLPDSSKVWLNSGSELLFNNDFINGKREVILNGEAFFSVAKDPEHPFHVTCKDISVEVLGTEFNVEAYKDENQISTTLVEGTIKLMSKGASAPAILSPGDKMVYDKVNSQVALYKNSDIDLETAWKQGRLVFKNEKFEDLRLKLERWFDVNIELLDDNVKNSRYTGSLENETIFEVISYFDTPSSIESKIEGNKIIFYTNTNTN